MTPPRRFRTSVIATLGLGIGLSTAVFTVAETVLIRKLPVARQDELVVLNGATPDGQFSNFPISMSEYGLFRDATHAFRETAHFAYYGASELTISDGASSFRLRRAMVSGNLFDVLGARSALGRTLNAGDDRPGAPPVIVLSHRAWTQQFGADSGVVGRTVTVIESGARVSVAGVMAAGLDFPTHTDFWAPLTRTASGTADSLHLVSPTLNIVGRLAPGATLAQARGEMTTLFRRDGAPAMEKDVRGVATSFPILILGDTRPALIAASVAALLLFLLACFNVANLLLVRGLGRSREIAIRTALGASRGRVVRELIGESARLAVMGSALGGAVALSALALFKRVAPRGLPRLNEVSSDWSVLAIAVLTGSLALIAVSIAPALLASRSDPGDALRAGGDRSGDSRSARRVAEWLVACQMALATAVIVTAGLTVRSLDRLIHVNVGVTTERLLVVDFSVRAGVVSNVGERTALYDRLARRIQALPGVEAATPALNAPFAPPGHGIAGRFTAPGQTPEQVAASPIVNMEIVAPDYFRTLGTAIARGRSFNAGDVKGAQAVVVVSQATADFYWPGENPIGKTLGWNAATAGALTVVGVAADTRYRELRIAHPAVYLPLAQSVFPVAPSVVLVRAQGREAKLVPAIRRAADETSPALIVVSAKPFEDYLAEPAAQTRMVAMVFAMFATAALFLAAVGLFGVISEQMTRRRREFGIRAAIGANPRQVASLILRRGGAITMFGGALGVAIALGLGRITSALLFEVSSNDPAVLISGVAILALAAAIACAGPAVSAARTSPTDALRGEG